jgi:hypothetical protein
MSSKDYAGVLISTDAGKSWTPHGHIVQPGNHEYAGQPGVDRVIEGAIVPLATSAHDPNKQQQTELMQLFRTTRDTTYTSTSHDSGITWSRPQRNNLPNPNTKMHAIRLSNGVLMAAYNHHKYKLRQRSNLFVATSSDR